MYPVKDEIACIKNAWLSENPSHHLTRYVCIFGKVFGTTNCELTALAIRIALANSPDDWEACDEAAMSALVASRATPDSSMYQVTFHDTSPRDDESQFYNASHIMTIVDNRTFQSYFREYEWKCDVVENMQSIEILRSGMVTTTEEWFTLTGVREAPTSLPQYIWFWLPQPVDVVM